MTLQHIEGWACKRCSEIYSEVYHAVGGVVRFDGRDRAVSFAVFDILPDRMLPCGSYLQGECIAPIYGVKFTFGG